MSFVINTNVLATAAAGNLQHSSASLQKSIARLSSGKKIVSPADDAGGLAVSMKMMSAIKRNHAVQTNIANSISFLQTQDGAMSTATKVIDRMSELLILSKDSTKNAADKSNYQTEFAALQAQLSNIKGENFNGVSLFASSGALSVVVTEDGTKTVTINQADIASALTDSSTDITNSSNSLGNLTVQNMTNVIQSVATLRATNGAQTSQLHFATDMLNINKTNLESANSRILDTDVAEESTVLAKYNILAQSGTAMLTQANSLPRIALQLLQQ